ncbi:hypothetical protein [Acinetobacter modestus]|uniref:Lipoprotein n=1 Tax=Acinetobacter modestus TaxID=1776740 RepID=A0ABN0JP35_9GAMM|nr:hypothetical protein [Acinetobacter modestus]ENU27008.1 hypothetical protein F992_01612 [Acinetobacter modestus]GGA17671.1 hypothetical protein GCM10017554_13040 [Acinetobacter modestus]
MEKVFLKSLLILTFISIISGCVDYKLVKKRALHNQEVEYVPAQGSNWFASKDIEERSGKITFNMATLSNYLNTKNEPFSSTSNLVFLYTQAPNDNSVLLSVTRGLAECPETDCEVTFKFDEEKPIKVKMFVLDDFDGHSFKIRNAKDRDTIVELVKKSKQLKVDIPLMNNGVKTAQFDVSNFNYVFERFLKENNS